MAGFITAEEAAARLGVKKATLYAYVSRGQLAREKAVDGRHSMFDPDEIDALASGRRRPRRGELATAIQSRITRVDLEHFGYRGQAIESLVTTPFEDVASLMWCADGSGQPWVDASDTVAVARRVQSALPDDALLIDRLRATAAAAPTVDPLRYDTSQVAGAGQRLITAMVDALPIRGEERSGSLADRLWVRLAPTEPTDVGVAALNAALVLIADHGLATSTFAVRVAASVRADPYSAVFTGLGAVGGTLHGAASGQVHRMFVRAAELNSATAGVSEILRTGNRVPGFGHKVYKHGDPRFALLSRLVIDSYRRDLRLLVVNDILNVVSKRITVLPNIDFAMGALTYLADMSPDAGEAIFAIGRTAGWLAHAAEEYDEAPVRFRPQARYVGPMDLG
ncbi:MAG: citrate/2-methylcitrate synthase [Acidimicrobiales bacterium]